MRAGHNGKFAKPEHKPEIKLQRPPRKTNDLEIPIHLQQQASNYDIDTLLGNVSAKPPASNPLTANRSTLK